MIISIKHRESLHYHHKYLIDNKLLTIDNHYYLTLDAVNNAQKQTNSAHY